MDDIRKLVHNANESLKTDNNHPLNTGALKIGGTPMTVQEKTALLSDIQNVDIDNLELPVDDIKNTPEEVKQRGLNYQRNIVSQLRRNTTKSSMASLTTNQARAMNSVIGGSLTESMAAAELEETKKSRLNPVSEPAHRDNADYTPVDASIPTATPNDSEDESFTPIMA